MSATPLTFDGKVILITGAGRGLGAAYAKLFAARGARVVVNDLGGDMDGAGADNAAATTVVREISASGGKAIANFDDIRDAKSARNIVDAALHAYGRLDCVVNNAGIISAQQFQDLTSESIYKQLDVHLIGSLNVTQAAWPELVNSRGSVILTCSGGMIGNTHTMAYNIAKAAVYGLARSLACSAPDVGVRVNAIMPSGQTRMQSLTPSLKSNADSDRERPVHRPDNAAALVCFLAHDSCRSNGEMFTTGRGHVARTFLASTPGYTAEHLTVETIAEHFPQILNTDGFHVETTMEAFRERRYAAWT